MTRSITGGEATIGGSSHPRSRHVIEIVIVCRYLVVSVVMTHDDAARGLAGRVGQVSGVAGVGGDRWANVTGDGTSDGEELKNAGSNPALVTQLTAAAAYGSAQSRSRNDPVALGS